jgi:hypothetical protein
MPLVKNQTHIFGEPHGQVGQNKNTQPTISCSHRNARRFEKVVHKNVMK